MNVNSRVLLVAAFFAAFCVTGFGQNRSLLEKSPVVGSIVDVNGAKVVAAKQSLLKDTLRINLSDIADGFEIIHLDNRDEALVGETPLLCISDNYLLVGNNRQNPVKLFDRKGKFLTVIGAYGQGPEEYQNIYQMQLDEPNNRIYILPWQSNKLLVYDLKGNSLTYIPIGPRVPKGNFYVDQAASTVAVASLPFPGYPVAWTLDMEGKLKVKIDAGHLAVPQTFSNEVGSSRNAGRFDLNIMSIEPTRVDSLYYFDYKNSRLVPCFTMNFKEEKTPWHAYSELPGFYLGDISYPVQVGEGRWTSSAPTYYIIDKTSARGAYFRLYNDFLGGREIGWPIYAFRQGYFVSNTEPGVLMEQLEAQLPKIKDAATKKRVQEILDSLDENDNNVIILAKLKK